MKPKKYLTPIAHTRSTAAPEPSVPTVLPVLALFGRVNDYACGRLGRKAPSGGRLRRLARNWSGKCGLGLLLVLFLSSPLSATSVRIVNLADMVELSDRIFRGSCLAVVEVDIGVGLPVLEYTFEILEGVKGVRTGQTLTFRQVLPGSAQLPGIRGVPRYKKGQELMVFLHGDSKLGLTSPVGLAQGVFRLLRLESGEVGALNAVGNRNLGWSLSRQSAQAMGLEGEEAAILEGEGPVPLRVLNSAVRRIDERQRLQKGAVR